MSPKLPTATAIRETLKVLGTKQSDQERAIVAGIVERTEELLCEEPFEVSSNGTFIRVTGTGEMAGKTTVMMQGLMWRATLDVDERLRMIFESYAARLQQFMSKATGSAWPQQDCAPRVTVTREAISVAWEDTKGHELVRELRTISRADIGLSEGVR
jgi:hypothetical protein